MVTQTDSALNSNSSQRFIFIDTIAPTGLTINEIAGDNVINANEQATTITGTNERGATVQISIGGVDRVARVNGTQWQYTLTADDITRMGQGGEELLVTQADGVGNTQSLTKQLVINTVAPFASRDWANALASSGESHQ